MRPMSGHLPMTTSESVLGVDTNVVVRFFADDDDIQSGQAKQLLGNTDNQPIYLSMLVLSEAFTVLTKVRRFSMQAVHEGYRGLLLSPDFQLEDPHLVGRAIDDGAATGCGFADALIALQNQAAGCSVTATFDHRAARLEGMKPAEDFL